MMVVELLEKLVEIPSPSGYEDRIVEFLTAYLEELGFDAVLQEVKNVIVNPDASLWIVTHMDTVRIKSKFHFDGVYAYGTGVCDAKGSIAAILLALEGINKLNLGIAFLVDEEESGKGSKLFVKEYKPKKVVVMEPTQLAIVNCHYGSLEVVVEVKGFSAHGSMPEHGDNAIENALRLVSEIKSLCIGKHSIQEIGGGSNEYIIPDSCRLRFDFVFSPDIKATKLKNKVLQVAEKYGRAEVVEEYDGFFASRFFTLEEALRRTGIEVRYGEMHSWTDATHLKNAGCDAIVWGPGELRYCHTAMERISIDEILKASKIIVNLNELLIKQ
jgi:acetylornithine deacetylase